MGYIDELVQTVINANPIDDPAGNQTQKEDSAGITYYTFNAASRMTQAEPPAGIVTLTYNADGQRVRKESTDGSVTNFLYDHKNLLQETDDSDDPTVSYTTTSDEYGDLISEYDEPGSGGPDLPGGGEFYHQFDAQAATNAMTDDTGSVTQRFKYQAFGLPASSGQSGWANLSADQWSDLSIDGWATLPVNAPSEMSWGGAKQYYLDPETELYLLGSGNNGGGGRYYDPDSGRFTSEDRIRYAAGDYNLFRYVKNNPVSKIDPGGTDEILGEGGYKTFKWEDITINYEVDKSGNYYRHDVIIETWPQLQEYLRARHARLNTSDPFLNLQTEELKKGNIYFTVRRLEPDPYLPKMMARAHEVTGHYLPDWAKEMLRNDIRALNFAQAIDTVWIEELNYQYVKGEITRGDYVKVLLKIIVIAIAIDVILHQLGKVAKRLLVRKFIRRYSKLPARAIEEDVEKIANALEEMEAKSASGKRPSAEELAKKLDEMAEGKTTGIHNASPVNDRIPGARYASGEAQVVRSAGTLDTIPEGQRITTYYPPNGGITGSPVPETLQPGTMIDRFGPSTGRFAAPAGTPIPMRSLPYGTAEGPYSMFRVLKPIDVQSGTTAPWFGQLGGGTQYEFSQSIQSLLQSGHLERVNP